MARKHGIWARIGDIFNHLWMTSRLTRIPNWRWSRKLNLAGNHTWIC